jgi:hypothetical protein
MREARQARSSWRWASSSLGLASLIVRAPTFLRSPAPAGLTRRDSQLPYAPTWRPPRLPTSGRLPSSAGAIFPGVPVQSDAIAIEKSHTIKRTPAQAPFTGRGATSLPFPRASSIPSPSGAPIKNVSTWCAFPSLRAPLIGRSGHLVRLKAPPLRQASSVTMGLPNWSQKRTNY